MLNRPAPGRAALRAPRTALRPLALALATLSLPAAADTPHGDAARVVVTGNLLKSESFELAPAVSTLSGRELSLRRESTLGDTVNALPGVAATAFGPNASRPIIRGLDGDRIRVLEDGVGATDASSVSFDHATTVDPLLVDRIEVLRGPAALLYGGNAIGGVVNAIDHRIPTEGGSGFGGRAEARYGGAATERSGAALIDFATDRFAFHADAFARRSEDLRIPGPALSARLRERVEAGEAEVSEATLHADGRLPNSAAEASGGALGASLVGDWGHLGIGWSQYATNYGVVAEPEVTIDMESTRLDLSGEWTRKIGFIEGVKAKVRQTDYRHTELDAGEPATRFANKGWESRVEARHARLGNVQGAFGLQASDHEFSALGDEAFVPATQTRSLAGFVFEELTLGTVKLSGGLRFERNEIESAGGERFDPADSRSFSLGSGALGAVWSFSPGWALAANFTHSDRAPTFYELYADGPHAATGAYEVGDRGIGKEHSNAAELFLRFKGDAASFSVGGFVTRFGNYIALGATGRMRGADGTLDPGPGYPEEVLPEYAYFQAPARFVGLEAEGSMKLAEGAAGRFDLSLRGDLVRATRRDTGEHLPRITPARLGAALDWQYAGWSARLDLQHAFEQTRTAPDELPTEAYTLVNAAVSVRLPAAGATWDAWLKASNLTDAEARAHTSFLKDVAPMGGRALLAGLRASF